MSEQEKQIETEEKKEVVSESVIAIALSEESLAFIKDNPKIANIAGRMVSAIAEYKERIETVEDLLYDESIYSILVEKGTQDDLKAFLKNLSENLSESRAIIKAPPGTFDAIVNSIDKDKISTVVHTKIDERDIEEVKEAVEQK